MNMIKFDYDFVERSIAILKNSPHHIYDATLMLDSLLGTIVIPIERNKLIRDTITASSKAEKTKNKNKVKFQQYVLRQINAMEKAHKVDNNRKDDTPLTEKQKIHALRNGLCHGRILVNEQDIHEKYIKTITIKDKSRDIPRKDGYDNHIAIHFTVDELRKFAIELAEYYLELFRPKAYPIKTIQIPIGHLKVSAGTGIPLDDDYGDGLIEVKDTPDTRAADFCLMVSGDSMEPEYHNGDIVLVKKAISIEEGKVGIFTIGDRGYMKVLGEGCLESLNSNYDPIYFTGYEPELCVGEVIGVCEKEDIISGAY